MKITVNVRYDDRNKVLFHRTFTIEDRSYEIGDIYDGETVLEVERITPDIENNSDVNDYSYYRLVETWNGEDCRNEGDYSERFIAVRKED